MSHHTTLHRGRKTAAATLIAVVAAAALTACDAKDGKDSKAGAAAAPSAAASPADASSSQESAGQGQGAPAGPAKTARTAAAKHTSPAGSPAGPASGARCTTDVLKTGWGADGGGRPDMNSDQQQTATVWLKNIGGRTCTLGGFPGVRITGTDGTAWDLPRSAKKPVAVRLKPGAHTSFTLTLLPSTSAGDRKIAPSVVTVTPPDEKKHFQLKWPYGGALLDQSGATHPGTYVNPVNAG
ncbi:DUF4232 domain-containing protein [Streptomyces natalensis]|uniref:DUF4232 domain-containing protein n=1 Tax=Streptomyces natalensis ATCC 27448 TaxID=1240678 RepID=A0A0D7CUI6_9ACTN|nr:DUF4232 domain-containing protein [Streptomyces natalensis]KIZ19515.1 hypothetical protein SNA_03090 [Streptomyces natalensis ATCC 27448]